jgi:hypothetical protein
MSNPTYVPLDKWCETEAAKLTRDIDCHLRVMLEGNVEVDDEEDHADFLYSIRRLIMGSVREELQRRQEVTGKKRQIT